MGNIEQALSKMMEKSQICSGVLGNINVILGFCFVMRHYPSTSTSVLISMVSFSFIHSLMNRKCLLSTLPLA